MPLTRSSPRLHYEVVGDAGPPVLLVMGFAMRGIVWRPQLDGLSAHHRCCVYDHPGIGQSEPGRRFPLMRHFAGHAVRLLDELGWETAHLVGVSMGGMISQELACAVPERLRSLTLIATHGGGPNGLPTLEGIKLFLRANLAPAEDRIAALQRLLYPPEFLQAVDRARMSQRMNDQMGRRPPARTLLRQLHAVVRHRAEARLPRVKLPTLVIRPGRDVVIRPGNSDRLHALIPGSRLLRLDGAGHGVTFQEQERVNAALLEHFARAEAVASAPAPAPPPRIPVR